MGVAGGVATFRNVRVGACADELRLTGVVRRVVSTGEIGVGEGGFFGEKVLQCLCATRYGADVERALRRRRELDYAVRGKGWTFEGASLRWGESLFGNKRE